MNECLERDTCYYGYDEKINDETDVIKIRKSKKLPPSLKALYPTKKQSYKEELEYAMITEMKKCIEEDRCEPIKEVVYIRYDKCPICKAELPYFIERNNKLMLNGIIHSYTIIDVDDVRGKDLYKKYGCHGTPCEIALFDDDKKSFKIKEGRLGDIGWLSAISGIENPLYEHGKIGIPKKLLKEGVNENGK